MTRYVRLGYLVPRLVLLIVLFCLVEFGSGWALRYALVSGGEQAIGARVEIGESVVSFVDARATLRDLRVANPQRPMENLLEAEKVELDFEADSLLRRKAIAQQGVVRGLRFGTPRTESGALDPSDDDPNSPAGPAWLGDAVGQAASQAADRWIANLEQKFSLEANDLESVALAMELAESWPARFETISADAEAVRIDVEELRRIAVEARSNPLRHADFLADAPKRTAALRQRIEGLHAELDGVPAQLAADRARVEAARHEDERRLRERLQADQLDPQALTSHLLGENVAGPIRELVGWVRWSREMIPARSAAAKTTERSRGADVHFAGVRRRPDLLIRTLDLSGTARLAGRPVELSGVVTDLTTSPELHDAPLRLALQTAGALPLEVRATIDRSGATPVDDLIVDCPALDLPEAELGDADRFAMTMAPSTGSLSISLRVEGERLSGEVQLIQDSVRIIPVVRPQAGKVANRLAGAVGEGLSSLPKTATRVTLSGTLDRPGIDLWSTLGPAVAQSLDSAAQRLGEAEIERRIAQSRRLVAQEVGQLDRLVASATEDLTRQIEGPGQELKALATDWIGEKLGPGTFSFEKLGKRLPAGGSLFQ